MTVLHSMKKIVPVSIKRPLRLAYDIYRFRTQPRLQMSGTNLRRASDLDLGAVMADATIAAAYVADHAKIVALYGQDELSGGVNPGDRRAIYHLVASLKPLRVLELGTHISMSTAYIGMAMRSFSPPGASLTTVDVLDVNAAGAAWQQLGLPESPKGMLDRLGIGAEFVAALGLEFMQQARSDYDLIFLDGDHSDLAVYREISTALERLSPGGIILLHDYYPDCKPLTPEGSVIAGPARAGVRIQTESPHIKVVPLGELPWETKFGGRATSLAVVTLA
jgi:predicted O-methyltransferase YrrM